MRQDLTLRHFQFLRARSATILPRVRRWCIFTLTVSVFTLFSFSSRLVQAQQYLATLSGEVTDSSGAKLPQADVTATDVVTKFVTKTVTNGVGLFTIPSLSPGLYMVTISASGFRKETRNGILLTAGAVEQTDFALQVGNQSDQMLVSSDTALLDTASANLGDTLSQKEVSDIPNVGRNPFVLSTLAAGVTSGSYMQGKVSNFTIGGVAVQITANGSAGHNRLTLNGIPDDPAERLSGANYTGFVPSPEAVQEVKIQTALFDSQFGHGNGTITNTVVKNGTNDLHGAAYYVFQNTYMNANTYERVPNQNGVINSAAPTRRTNDQLQQTGFVVTGPMIVPKVYNGRNKTFFMVAFERYASHTPLPYSSRVPTSAERAGDFSILCASFVNGVCAAGAGIHQINAVGRRLQARAHIDMPVVRGEGQRLALAAPAIGTRQLLPATAAVVPHLRDHVLLIPARSQAHHAGIVRHHLRVLERHFRYGPDRIGAHVLAVDPAVPTHQDLVRALGRQSSELLRKVVGAILDRNDDGDLHGINALRCGFHSCGWHSDRYDWIPFQCQCTCRPDRGAAGAGAAKSKCHIVVRHLDYSGSRAAAIFPREWASLIRGSDPLQLEQPAVAVRPARNCGD